MRRREGLVVDLRRVSAPNEVRDLSTSSFARTVARFYTASAQSRLRYCSKAAVQFALIRSGHYRTILVRASTKACSESRLTLPASMAHRPHLRTGRRLNSKRQRPTASPSTNRSFPQTPDEARSRKTALRTAIRPSPSVEQRHCSTGFAPAKTECSSALQTLDDSLQLYGHRLPARPVFRPRQTDAQRKGRRRLTLQ